MQLLRVIMSLPPSGAIAVWTPVGISTVGMGPGQGSHVLYIRLGGPGDQCLQCWQRSPQTLALAQALQAPEPREKPAS